MTKWQKVKLGGYLSKVKTGKLDANASCENGEYPFFTCAIEPLRIDTYSYDCECVLVAGNGDLNVKYYEGKFDAYQRTYILESKDKKQLNVKFLYYFMRHYLDNLRLQAFGGIIKYIRLNNIIDAQIPLPPKEEQERIAKELDAVSDLLAKQKQLLTEQDTLIKSVFYDMFIKTNNNFKVLKLEDISELITDGVHAKPVYVEKGIPFISVKNITTGFLSFEDCKYISYQDYVKFCSRCHPTYGDILYTKVGATYGRAALVDVNADFSLYVSVALIKPKGNMVNSVFLKHMMNSENIKRQADKSIKGIGVPDLHLIEIKNFIVFVPPLSLQQKFADIVEQIEVQKQKIKSAITETETLFNALMAKYFDEE